MAKTSDQCRARLPAAVYELAIRLGVNPDAHHGDVTLTQTGRMKRSLDTEDWMAFTATQSISTRACEFDWLANMGPFGMISARDALDHGEGRLDVMALGIIPIARTKHTPALLRGELMRYLAEIAWAPDAILTNRALRWRLGDADTLIVGAGDGETAVEVILGLDSDGRIATAFASDRPRSAIDPILPTPWHGRFSEYRQHLGQWLPFAGEVAWEIGGQEIVYWQGRIASWTTAP
jgi:hypothetical protein